MIHNTGKVCPYCGSNKKESDFNVTSSITFECGSSKFWGGALPDHLHYEQRTEMCLYAEKLLNEIKDLKKCIDPFVYEV